MIFVVRTVLIPLEKKKKNESHKKVCENKDFCNEIRLSKNNKILEFNQYQKSDKISFFYLCRS